jgi:hypothetical protein
MQASGQFLRSGFDLANKEKSLYSQTSVKGTESNSDEEPH